MTTAKAHFDATLDMLPEMLSWIRDQITAAGFSKQAAHCFELALEEVVVNILHYAYAGHSGKIELHTALYPNDRLEFTITDEGVPFDPLAHTANRKDVSLEEMPEGGLGILLMRKNCDFLHYERSHSRNILKLGKKIKASCQ